MYKIIVFDLDDTLSESKQKIDEEMSLLLSELTKKYKVAIITWWEFNQISKQVLDNLDLKNTNFENLYIYPTCWAKMFQYIDWEYEIIYSEDLTEDEINNITSVLEWAIDKLWLNKEESWWTNIDNRWTQITYSPLWNECPLEIKFKWDPDWLKRQEIRNYIIDDLKDFHVWIAWRSSMDITKKWIDKAYWIKKIISEIWLEKKEILFMWDMLMPGWNDYPVKEFWVDFNEVIDPEDTKLLIRALLNWEEYVCMKRLIDKNIVDVKQFY